MEQPNADSYFGVWYSKILRMGTVNRPPKNSSKLCWNKLLSRRVKSSTTVPHAQLRRANSGPMLLLVDGHLPGLKVLGFDLSKFHSIKNNFPYTVGKFVCVWGANIQILKASLFLISYESKTST